MTQYCIIILIHITFLLTLYLFQVSSFKRIDKLFNLIKEKACANMEAVRWSNESHFFGNQDVIRNLVRLKSTMVNDLVWYIRKKNYEK